MKSCLISLVFILMFIHGKAFAIMENVIIKGSQGNLAAIVQRPEMSDNQKVPLVVICHGFGGHKNCEIEKLLAAGLEKIGIASIRFDFNAHGESEGKFENMTVLNEIEDAIAVVNYAKTLSYVKSVSLSGHSQGGVVAGMTAGKLGCKVVKSLCLMAPAAVLREDAIRGCTFGKTYNPLDPPDYVVLPGNLRLGKDYITTAFNLDIFGVSSAYKGKVCLIHGTGDKIAPYSYSELYKRIYGTNASLNILEGFDHGFSQDITKVVKIAISFFTEQLM